MTDSTLSDLFASTLSDLFAQSDKIGDAYLSPEEIEKRNAELAKLKAEIEALSQSN